jgi:Holliday junction DNA helicase RuvB
MQTNRPESLDHYFGQEMQKSHLAVLISSAKKRAVSLDHLLITGNPGLGKTTLARIIANELGSSFKSVHAATVKRKGDLISLLASLNENDVIFLDEIHSLDKSIAEILYTAMEDRRIDVACPGETVSIELNAFTLIGATTKSGMLEKPLLDRFGEIIDLDDYDVDQMSQIIQHNAEKSNIGIDQSASLSIAKRSHGTPRIGLKLLKRCVDYAVACDSATITDEVVALTMKSMGIDDNGLDKSALSYIRFLDLKKDPVGISSIAASTGESVDTIENVIEPSLLRLRLIDRSTRGRILTEQGRSYLRS